MYLDPSFTFFSHYFLKINNVLHRLLKFMSCCTASVVREGTLALLITFLKNDLLTNHQYHNASILDQMKTISTESFA